MNNKEFRFQGLDAKTELKLALMLIFPSLMIMFGILYGSHILFPKISFLMPLLFGATTTVGISIIILKQLTNLVREKEWIINIDDKFLNLKFRGINHHIQLSDIKIIKNLGNIGLRYLTIKTKNNVIKIRVGNTGLAPFSKQKDIDELDAFVQYLKPYIDKHFNEKVLKNIVQPNIIPNFGVYVVKEEKIKYSIINRMKPWQVVVFILGILVLIMILFVNIMEYIFFK
ncbi:hypothetical protein EG346_00455 [Chryseobacterium carnipullorum]|uniref:Uncharacterized protein n=1 Tax=Chryseobacterium carnipullorum TaxID=1124835 RepID=A0A376ED80_CHRCU|nr:hypothetical protein [Chryseobacterium carnipullorum]AZA46779.1 hypothetical protein EG346_00455 [Chryseobacterium carnipullorum]AZA66140.1 hypothetical protein EG345_16530 [Chryseobacterium carnipullorum]STD05761.1 Uncharacterised protein [Chryseobacterium carnipullorum]